MKISLFKGFKLARSPSCYCSFIFIIIIILPFSSVKATGRTAGPILTKKNTQMQLKGYIGPLKILRLSDQGLRGDNSKLIPKKIRFLPISPSNISRFASNLLYGHILPIPTNYPFTPIG